MSGIEREVDRFNYSNQLSHVSCVTLIIQRCSEASTDGCGEKTGNPSEFL